MGNFALCKLVRLFKREKLMNAVGFLGGESGEYVCGRCCGDRKYRLVVLAVIGYVVAIGAWLLLFGVTYACIRYFAFAEDKSVSGVICVSLIPH